MVLIDYFQYIWCYKSGQNARRRSPYDQFSWEVISLNLSIYLLTFGIIVLISGVVVREVSAPIANSDTTDTQMYGIGTIILIFGSILVWFGFILLGCSLIRFHCKGSPLTRPAAGDVSLYSIYNNNYVDMTANAQSTEDTFDWTLERPPPYSEPSGVAVNQTSLVS